MSASLENSYAASQRSAAAALEERRAELSAQEANIADARVRFDAERLVSFYDELLAPQVADAIASLVQGFLAHEEACSRTLAEALELAERPANERLRITQFNDVLNELDQLLEEAGQLESSITAISPRQAECIVQLSDRPEQGSRLIATLSALLVFVQTDLMSASISDPFLLASYSLPSLPGRASFKSSASKASHVLVDSQYASTSDKANSFVSLAVQGDGVHVLDLSTLHPATSHTLGPNTRFACPPASRTSKRNGVQTCTTYGVIDSSPDIEEDHRGRAVWWWEESLSGGVMTADAQRKRQSALVSHRITHICAPEDLPEYLLLVGPNGRITITDAELTVYSSIDAESEEAIIVRHFVFPLHACGFISSQLGGVVSISVLKRGTNVIIAVSTVNTGGQIQSLGRCTIPEKLDIADASISSSGCLTVMSRSGVWSSYSLSATPTLTASPLCSPVSLNSLSFISPTGHPIPHCSEISILALTSSHVLLAGMPHGEPEIVLLIWDMQYGIALAEHRFHCPSHLHHGQQRGVAIELVVSGSTDQALLILHPATGKHEQTRATSVLVVPYVVPKISTIANALGRAAASQQWLRVEGESRKRHAPPTRDFTGVTPLQERSLKAMLAAQHSRDLSEVQNQWKVFVKAVPNPSVQPCLGHLFVKHVLDIVFLVTAPSASQDDTAPAHASTPYARDTVKYLLERKAVSDAMVDGGLIPALMERKDWENAVLALSTVSDLPESAVISLLAQVVAQHRRQSASDAMQVDAPSALPTLPAFLTLCVNYAASPGPLRVALKKHLPHAEDVVCVLEILDGWLERWGAEKLQLVPEGVKKDESGAYVAVLTEQKVLEIPPLDKVLAFISAFLDSSFLALLTYQPAHPLLRTLLARLEPELALASELQALKGPLQAFLTAPRRADRQRKPDTPAEQIKWKRAQAEEREMNVGIYQVETLWL
ncbi:hypothetical protein FOMPIDRAFT_1164819 [Fomitopsis schrenkii]|uniref:Uncharacterized protein n=1 Tax=Fomitopsis schrenkii TaxID=2126942 RepID=S8FK97_FOMSC|nr:hypothetical protein FOMPIDRAFT_1164819 [Fomitopsis schrenkii]